MGDLVKIEAKKAFVYLRVSTDEQADKGGFPRQERTCLEYARKQGIQVVEIFKDDYTGSVPIGERPEGAKLMARLAKGEANVLILENATRLHRPKEEGDEIEALLAWKKLRKMGVELHLAKNGHIKDFVDLLVLLLEGKSSGDEYQGLIEKTTQGRRDKARKGMVTGQGKPPYGYKFLREKRPDGSGGSVINLEILPSEAAVVEQVFRWYVHGDDDKKPLGFASIARRLDGLGIVTPSGGNFWQYSTVSKILASQYYMGKWYYGKRGGSGGSGGKRPKSEQIAVDVPVIVSPELWHAAQRQRKINKTASGRNSRQLYLLRGRVECWCGGKLGGFCGGRKKHRYYRCTFKANRHTRKCTQKMVRADAFEAAGWDYLLWVMQDRETFERALLSAQAQQQSAQAPLRDRLNLVNATIAQLEKQAEKLAVTITNQDGVVAATLQKQADDLNTRYKSLTEKREKLTAELAQEALTDSEIDRLLHWRDDIVLGMEAAQDNPERRMQIMGILDLQVKLVKQPDDSVKVKFSCMLPVPARVIDLPTSSSAQTNYTFRLVELSHTVSLADILYSGVKTLQFEPA